MSIEVMGGGAISENIYHKRNYTTKYDSATQMTFTPYNSKPANQLLISLRCIDYDTYGTGIWKWQFDAPYIRFDQKNFYGTFRDNSGYYEARAAFTENYDSGIIILSNLTLDNGTVIQFPVSPSKNECLLYLEGYTYQ